MYLRFFKHIRVFFLIGIFGSKCDTELKIRDFCHYFVHVIGIFATQCIHGTAWICLRCCGAPGPPEMFFYIVDNHIESHKKSRTKHIIFIMSKQNGEKMKIENFDFFSRFLEKIIFSRKIKIFKFSKF